VRERLGVGGRLALRGQEQARQARHAGRTLARRLCSPGQVSK
jgi:hypothetical protein